jgi:hypothetical protein
MRTLILLFVAALLVFTLHPHSVNAFEYSDTVYIDALCNAAIASTNESLCLNAVEIVRYLAGNLESHGTYENVITEEAAFERIDVHKSAVSKDLTGVDIYLGIITTFSDDEAISILNVYEDESKKCNDIEEGGEYSNLESVLLDVEHIIKECRGIKIVRLLNEYLDSGLPNIDTNISGKPSEDWINNYKNTKTAFVFIELTLAENERSIINNREFLEKFVLLVSRAITDSLFLDLDSK